MLPHTSKFNKFDIFMVISQMRKLRCIEVKMLTAGLGLESLEVGTKLAECCLV